MAWCATFVTHDTRLIIDNTREFFTGQKGQKIGLKLLCGDVDLFPEGGCNNLITGSLGVVGGLGNGDEAFC